jgi:hypothetical protein
MLRTIIAGFSLSDRWRACFVDLVDPLCDVPASWC